MRVEDWRTRFAWTLMLYVSEPLLKSPVCCALVRPMYGMKQWVAPSERRRYLPCSVCGGLSRHRNPSPHTSNPDNKPVGERRGKWQVPPGPMQANARCKEGERYPKTRRSPSEGSPGCENDGRFDFRRKAEVCDSALPNENAMLIHVYF